MATTNATTTSDVAPAVEFYYRRRWIKEPGRSLVWGAWGEQVDYPKGHGDQVKIDYKGKLWLSRKATITLLGIGGAGALLNGIDLLPKSEGVRAGRLWLRAGVWW